MKTWKRSLTPPRQKDLEFQVALRDVATKNHAMSRMLLWVEAHLRAGTPHKEILDGLTGRMSAPHPTGDTEYTEAEVSL